MPTNLWQQPYSENKQNCFPMTAIPSVNTTKVVLPAIIPISYRLQRVKHTGCLSKNVLWGIPRQIWSFRLTEKNYQCIKCQQTDQLILPNGSQLRTNNRHWWLGKKVMGIFIDSRTEMQRSSYDNLITISCTWSCHDDSMIQSAIKLSSWQHMLFRDSVLLKYNGFIAQDCGNSSASEMELQAVLS